MSKQAESEMVSFGRSLMSSVLISSSLGFVPSCFAAHIVMDRVSRAKHLHFMATLSVWSYWIGNLLFDVIVFLVPCFLSFGVMLLFGIRSFENEGLLVLAVMMATFAVSVLSLTYLLSFLFVSPQSAQTILGRIYEMSGLVLLILGIMMAHLVPSGQIWWIEALLFLFRCFPNYALGEGLFNMSYAQQTMAVMASTSTRSEPMNIWKWSVLGRSLCFMSVSTVINLIAIGAVECISLNARIGRWFNEWTARTGPDTPSPSPLASRSMDSEVIAERERIERGRSRSGSSLEMVGLRKVYYPKMTMKCKQTADGKTAGFVAVDGLWCSVGRSEILGIIGSNGAGKSSTLKMLVKELVPTSGTAVFGNTDISKSSFLMTSNVGYCPQSESVPVMDGLMEWLTGREHFEFYCRIRGCSERESRLFVETLIEALSLTQFGDCTVGTYSGGNRRKICVGIALIGNPSVVLLDEPSTGIDPISRRRMWNLVSRMTRSETSKRSVLLTTHSMEEAESLCHRIGIMDRGNLQCIGTAQHLKTKYGDDGYRLFIKLEDAISSQKKKEFKRYVLRNVVEQMTASETMTVDIMLIDDDDEGNALTFSIRCCSRTDGDVGSLRRKEKKRRMPLGQIFGAIESVKSEFQILEYSVGQSTLEDVFRRCVRETEQEQIENVENEFVV